MNRVSSLVALCLAALLAAGFLTFSAVPGWSLRLGSLLLVLPLGVLLLVRLVMRRDRAAITIAAAIAWSAFVAIFQTAPAIRLLGTLGLEASVLIYLGAAGCWALGRFLDEPGRRLLPWVVIGALGVNALVGVMQVILQIDDGPFVLDDGRAHGLATYSVYYGSLVACGGVLLAALHVPRRWLPAQVIGVAGFGLACGLSGSRAATGAFVVGLVWLLAKRRDRDTSVMAAIGVAGLAAATLVASFFDSGSTDTGGNTLSRLGADSGVAGGGFRWRTDAWELGFETWLERPITGWGVGNFRQAVQGIAGPEFDQAAPRFDAHNIVVELLVAVGLPGLLLFAAFGVFCALVARGPLAIAAAVLALPWLLQPAGLSTLPLALLLLGASMPALASRLDGESPNAGTRHLPEFAAALGLVLLLGFMVTDVRLARAIDSTQPEQLATAAGPYPWDPLIADLVAQGWMLDAFDLQQTNTGSPDAFDRIEKEALKWSQRAADRQPDAARWFDKLGGRQAGFGYLDEAQRSVERAIELQPNRLDSWRLLQRIAVAREDLALQQRAEIRLCELGDSAWLQTQDPQREPGDVCGP